MYLVVFSLLLIGQEGLGNFFRHRPLLPIGWRIRYANGGTNLLIRRHSLFVRRKLISDTDRCTCVSDTKCTYSINCLWNVYNAYSQPDAPYVVSWFSSLIVFNFRFAMFISTALSICIYTYVCLFVCLVSSAILLLSGFVEALSDSAHAGVYFSQRKFNSKMAIHN